MRQVEGILRLATIISIVPLVRDHNLPALGASLILAAVWALVAYRNSRRANTSHEQKRADR